jgi:excisionase family DNA binding protein
MRTHHEDFTTPLGKILTVPQAAAQLQVSERTIYEWLRDGKLPGKKIGKVWRMSAEVLKDFLRETTSRDAGPEAGQQS